MIFKQEMVDAILTGRKTVTRRPVKTQVENNYATVSTNPESLAACRYEVGGGPGGTYALQGPPEKGSKARASTVPGMRLRVLSVEMMPLGQDRDLTDAEIQREGFASHNEMVRLWWKLYVNWCPDWLVHRIEFELVPIQETTP